MFAWLWRIGQSVVEFHDQRGRGREAHKDATAAHLSGMPLLGFHLNASRRPLETSDELAQGGVELRGSV